MAAKAPTAKATLPDSAAAPAVDWVGADVRVPVADVDVRVAKSRLLVLVDVVMVEFDRIDAGVVWAVSVTVTVLDGVVDTSDAVTVSVAVPDSVAVSVADAADGVLEALSVFTASPVPPVTANWPLKFGSAPGWLISKA